MSGFSFNGNTGDVSYNGVEVVDGDTPVSAYMTNNGTDGVHFPVGTTAERPVSPAPGLMRFNVDTDRFETFTSEMEWAAITLETDALQSIPTVIYVSNIPGAAQFTSIGAALASITTASNTNPFVVYVQPGTYIEPTITMKPFVNVLSLGGSTASTIVSSNPNNDTIHGANSAALIGFTISGATNATGVYFTSATNSPAGTFRMVDVRFIGNKTDLHVEGTAFATYVLSHNLHFVTIDNNTHVNLQVSSNGAPARMLSFDTDTIYIAGTGVTESVMLTGPQAEWYSDGLSVVSLGANSPADGIVVQNGATIRAVSVTVSGHNNNINVRNVGSAPAVRIMANISENSTTSDLTIAHPGTTGTFIGATNGAKTFIDSNCSVAAQYVDVDTKAMTIVGSLSIGHSQDTVTDVTDAIQKTGSLGVMDGGVITLGTNPLDVDISAGNGYLMSATTQRADRTEWTTTTLTLPADSNVYVFVNNSGVITYDTSIPSLEESILLGRVRTTATAIDFIARIPRTAGYLPSHLDDYIRTVFGSVFVAGSIVSENSGTPRAVDVSSGQYWYSQLEFNPSGGTVISFRQYYHISGVFTKNANTTLVTNTQYDDGTNAVSLTPGYFVKHTLHLLGDGADEVYALVYGRDQFATLQDAQTAPLPARPTVFTDISVPIAAIIMQEGVNNFIEVIDIRPRIGFQTPAVTVVTDHGDLTGLLDNDHPQYLLRDGTNTMTGGLNMNSFNITNAGLVNGVTVQNHASRHLPNGADALTTAAPTTSLSLSSINAVGIQNSLARSDHSHQITGVQASSAQLTALAGTATTGLYSVTGSGTSATRTLVTTGEGITVTNGGGLGGNPTFALSDDTAAMEAITTLGIATRTANNTWTTRSIVAPGVGLTITNPAGVGGNPTLSLANDLAAVEGLTSTGFTSRTATDAWAVRTLNQPVAGLTIANGDGVAGDPVFALANDLAAVESLSSTGFAVRTDIDTWDTRTINGSAGNIVITNGSGVAGNPSINLATAGTQGTYTQVTTDTFGRVVSGANPTTLAGYGITDAAPVGAAYVTIGSDGTLTNERALQGTSNQITMTTGAGSVTLALADNTVLPGTTNVILPTGTTAQETGTMDGALRYNTDTSTVRQRSNGAWRDVGTVTSVNATGTTGVSITGGPITTSGTFSLSLTNDLAALEGLSTTGISVRTGTDAWATRSIAVTAEGLSIVNASGAAGNPTINLANDLAAIETLNVNGMLTRTGTDAWAARAVQAPAAGITVTNGDGVAGNPTLGLANDLASVESLTTFGIAARTAGDTWTTRTIQGTTNQIAMTNGDGIAGEPVVALANNPVLPGTANVVVPTGTAAQEIGTTDGALRYNTDTTTMRQRTNGAWRDVGTVTSVNVASTPGINATGGPVTSSGTISLSLTNDLAAVEGLATTGMTARTGTDTWTTRTILGTASQISTTNGDGVAGNPTVALANNPVLPGTNNVIVPTGTTAQEVGLTDGALRYNTDTSTMRQRTNGAWRDVGTVTSVNIIGTAGIGVSGGPVTSSGSLSLSLTNDLAALEGLSTTGISVRTGTDTWTTRSIAVAAEGLSITNAGGIAGNPTINLANDLAAIEALNTNGMLARTGTDTWAARSVQAPAAGITVTNGNGISGDPTIGLANDLSAVEGLATTGITARTATDTWTTRTIQGTTNQITMTNGSGVAGDPTVAIANNPVLPGTASVTVPVGTSAQRPGSPTNGMLRYNTDMQVLEGYTTAPFASTSLLHRSMLHNQRQKWVDEFMIGVVSTDQVGSLGELGWTTSSPSGNHVLANVTAESNHPGIISATTGGANANNFIMSLGSSATSLVTMANQVEYMAWLVRIPAITTVTTSFGMGTDLSLQSSFGTDAVFFTFNPATSANWQFITRAASTSTTVTSTTAVVANTWYLLEMYFDGTTWTPVINGVTQTTSNTNVPTAAVTVGTNLTTNAGSARTYHLDYFAMMTRELGQRY